MNNGDLCQCSSGDNVLNLLLDEPRKISERFVRRNTSKCVSMSVHAVAVDLSQAQNSLLELKLAGIRCLSHHDFLVLLGETDDKLKRW